MSDGSMMIALRSDYRLKLMTRSMVRGVVLLVLALIFAPVHAQQSDVSDKYPTVAALQQAVIPPRDRVDLARRIYHVTNIPTRPTSAPTRQVGDHEKFWVANSDADTSFQVDATLQVVGQHIYMWLQDGANVENGALQALADAFDQHIYDQVRQLWGSEDNPGIDGDPHIYGLFTHGLGDSIAAYFQSDHTNPVQVVPTSNQHEMMFFNLDTIGSVVDTPDMESITAHEFQHMIRNNVDENEDTWMDEGFSVFTELYLGYQNSMGFALDFLPNPQTQLNYWAEATSARAGNYGAALMFITYFYERYGLDGIQKLSADPANGLQAVDNTLHLLKQPGVNNLFADWVLANYFMDPSLGDGRYGYKLLPASLGTAAPLARVESYPFHNETSANQYSADYYALDNLNGSTSLDVTVTVPDTVQLFPTDAASGRWSWYSNRGDESDTTLTHDFDLSNVTAATLNYKVWYYTEEDWDYAYLMVSEDGGATWAALPTSHTTDNNPHHTAYGPGYTGESNGWVNESVSLNQYAGKKIQVRFEMITDDAVTQPGMVIDDVAVPEIGYNTDFEQDGGGWQPAGWIRTDNVLPQQAWVQVAQQVGSDVKLTRRLTMISGGAPQTWNVPLEAGASQVVVAITPFAPLTIVPMPYTLNVVAK